MDLRRQLTTEILGKRFNNSFQLVTHAIDLAKRMLDNGHPIEGTEEVKNQAYQILTKILQGDEVITPYVPPEEDLNVLPEQEIAPGT
jgi:hypothetical protein